MRNTARLHGAFMDVVCSNLMAEFSGTRYFGLMFGMPDRRTVRSNRFLVPVILIGAALFVTGNGWMALRSVEWLETSQRWVDHTWEVIAQVERIMSSAKDAETSSRGYLLTADPSSLTPFEQARRDLPAEVEGFRQLTADNLSQQQRAAYMVSVLNVRMNVLAQVNALRAAPGEFDNARAMATMEDGRAAMGQVRLTANSMEDEERRLLGDRVSETRRAALRVRLTSIGASLLDFVLIFLISRYLARERALRLETENTAQSLAESRIEIERKADEVLRLNESLELRVQQRTAELEAANKELEAFSYSVSHDLRAPLRTIDGFSLALEEDYADVVGVEGKDYIQRVRTGVQRMGGLIDALLQLSRITRADIERKAVDVSDIAESVAGQVRDQSPGQIIHFSIEQGLEAFADSGLFRVALENLFGNAVKFSSRKAESRVDFGWDVDQKAYFVRDNGAGFDMTYKDKLFGAFNRLHGDRDFKGSGIGLATVARVIRRHHGIIWADSVLDRGSTFWFTLGGVTP